MQDNVFADIVATELSDRSMLKWLQTLGLHSFEARHFEGGLTTDTKERRILASQKRKEKEAAGDDVAEKRPKVGGESDI